MNQSVVTEKLMNQQTFNNGGAHNQSSIMDISVGDACLRRTGHLSNALVPIPETTDYAADTDGTVNLRETEGRGSSNGFYIKSPTNQQAS